MSNRRPPKKPSRASQAPAKQRKRPASRAETMALTREALLDAATELFAREGLDAPSLDAICQRAGFTRGAFYVHFADRDELLDAVMERIGLPFLDRVLGDDEPPSLATVFARFVSAALSGEYPLTAEGGVRPHQLLDACARSERVRARYVALVEESIVRLSAVIERDASVQLDAPARDVATLLLAAIIGAQTMLELGVDVALPQSAASLLGLLSAAKAEEPAQ